jgi:WD40 repeat protein/serine/threonine protein kinase
VSVVRNRDSERVRADWIVGDVLLDLYDVKEILGEGGMGKVYRVHHRGWNVDLALKRPKAQELIKAGGAETFTREAEAWVNLGLHAHIVSCYYVRTLHGIPCVFAEYVEGGSLADWIRSRRLYEGGPPEALERVLDIAIQMAWGLDYAHDQGLVHQDVKPANVMMTPDGTAKVTDFGLARAGARRRAGAVRGAGAQGDTLLATVGGMTPAYASPEQARGEPLSRKTDVWSWAVSVLEMFLGEVTWLSGQAAREVLALYRDSEPADSALPPMPDQVARLLLKCFSESPRERPQDQKEIAAALQGVYQGVAGKPHGRQRPRQAEDADSLNNRAVSQLDLERPDQAEGLWESALRIEPHHIQSTYNQGLHLWRVARLDDAELLSRLGEASRSLSGDWNAGYLTALVHLERGDYETALNILEPMLRAHPSAPEIQAALAAAKAHLHDASKLMRTFEGHEKSVCSISLSDDARVALSGSEDRKLKLWEIASGRCLVSLDVDRPVRASCLSGDGRVALSGNADRTLTLWDPAAGRRRTFAGRKGFFKGYSSHRSWVSAVCLDRDGHHAISGSYDRMVKLWEAATGRCLRTFKGHKAQVTAVGLNDDGRIAVSGDGDGTLKVWNVTSGRCLHTIKTHGRIASLCLSRDGRVALSGGSEKTLRLWDLSSGRCERVLSGHHRGVTSVGLSADGLFALSGSEDSTVKLWNATTGRCLHTFEGHGAEVTAVCLSADGRLAFSGTSEGVLKLWQLSSAASFRASPALCLVRKSEAVLSLELAYQEAVANAREALSRGDAPVCARHVRSARSLEGFSRGRAALEIWHALYKRLPKKCLSGAWEAGAFEGRSPSLPSICLSRDGRLALSAEVGFSFRLWDLARGESLRTFDGHEGGVTSLCLSDDGRVALSGSDDKRLRLWDVATGRSLRVFEGHAEDVQSVCLSEDGRWALSGSHDKTLKLWEVATGRCLRTLTGHQNRVKSVCLSRGARIALSMDDDGTIKLWEIATGRCFASSKKADWWWTHAAYLGEDARGVLLVSKRSTLSLWEVPDERYLRHFEGHRGSVNTACLSADKRFALSGGEDETVRLWDVTTGHCIRVFSGHNGPVEAASLSRDGRLAISGGRDNKFRLWMLDWELEDREPVDAEPDIRPHLESFLAFRTPYAYEFSPDREPSEEEIARALTRSGAPSWSEAAFRDLLAELEWAGFGYVTPAGVRGELERMARDWRGFPPLPGAS